MRVAYYNFRYKVARTLYGGGSAKTWYWIGRLAAEGFRRGIAQGLRNHKEDE